MDTQYPVGLGVRKELDHTLGVEVGLRTGVGGEGEVSNVVLDAGLLELLLVLANPGNLGVGVHDGGDGAVVDVAVALSDVLDGSDSLLLSLVGKHGAEGAVTDSADVGDLGAVLLVDDQAAAVIGLKTDVVETKTGSVRTAANGDEDNISVKGFSLAALGSLDVDLDALLRDLTSHDLGVELEDQALLLEDLLGVLGDLLVHTGATNLAEELDNGDLGAETRPDGGLCRCQHSISGYARAAYHLETNDTATNDDHLLGNLLESDSTSGGDDALLVDGQAGEGCGLGASGDEDVLSADLSLAALDKVDSDGVLVLECAGTLDVLDVVLLEEELDALGEARDRGLLRLHHGAEVELDIADLDTAVLGVVEDLVVEVGVVQERLGGDAADVQAGSAEGAALLDTGDLRAC